MTKHMESISAVLVACGCLVGQAYAQSTKASAPSRSELFEPIRSVFQHPRCQNCHIPGDGPLQFDDGQPHAQNVRRGRDGKGMPGMRCGSCHHDANLPASYGDHVPPGAPHWGLPPPDQKMAWIGLSPRALCETIKDKGANGGRELQALITHISTDKLVLWGWNPGGERKPVPVPHDVFVARFKQWAEAGAPCPD